MSTTTGVLSETNKALIELEVLRDKYDAASLALRDIERYTGDGRIMRIKEVLEWLRDREAALDKYHNTRLKLAEAKAAELESKTHVG